MQRPKPYRRFVVCLASGITLTPLKPPVRAPGARQLELWPNRPYGSQPTGLIRPHRPSPPPCGPATPGASAAALPAVFCNHGPASLAPALGALLREALAHGPASWPYEPTFLQVTTGAVHTG